MGGSLEEGHSTTVRGARLSNALAVRPATRAPVVVRVAEIPEVPGGAECATLADAGKWCIGYGSRLAYTGIELAAGAPLVLNGVADMPEFEEPVEIDLSHVFLEFDGSDAATFVVLSSESAVATAEMIADAVLRVAPVDTGTATVTVTATAADGRTATRTFVVGVPPPAPEVPVTEPLVPEVPAVTEPLDSEDAQQPRFLRGWRLGLLEGVESQP